MCKMWFKNRVSKYFWRKLNCAGVLWVAVNYELHQIVPVGLEKFEALRLARPAIDTPSEVLAHERDEPETCNTW